MFKRLEKRKSKTRNKQIKLALKDSKKDVELIKTCQSCGLEINQQDLVSNYYKCPNCNEHFRMRSNERIELIFDRFIEINSHKVIKNPLEFEGYEEKLNNLIEQQGINEAVITGYGSIGGRDVVGIVMDPFFMMGSMGSVVGEKITKAFERATTLKYPIIMFSASGGARMQEGIFSLMQMAKTSGAVARHSDGGNLFINVFTDPTTGGVSASFAMLGDILLAEPNSLIGFAGPRVIEQTIKQKLPEDFQKAEFLLEKGFIDKVVDRQDMKNVIKELLTLHGARL